MPIICSRCIYDSETPGITFDEQGVCNYCHTHDTLCEQFPSGDVGKTYLEQLAETIRQSGKGKPYDCIVGVSGGCDSTYLLHVAVKELGLRPLAVHFDNTWNSSVAQKNMQRIVTTLGVDLEVYAVDSNEYNDIYRAFLKAGVPDIESPTDIALAAVLNGAAEKHGIKYILEGHNFRTEGVSPLGWLYMDGKYIQSVHHQHGVIPMKTYPNMYIMDMLRWMIVRGIQKIRPFWYMDYDKEDIKRFLTDTYGWEWYGGHHLENKFTAFYHSYFMPHRFNIDCRSLGYAAQVRGGYMKREEALALYSQPATYAPEALVYIKERLELSEAEFELYMTQSHKRFTDYPNYKKLFERLRPFFWIMAKLNRIPWSFYMKYTKPLQ